MKYEHWRDAYREFENVVDNNPVDQIDSKVEALYLQHEGDPVWDLAYLKWIEPLDDDQVLNAKLTDTELAGIFAYCARLCSLVSPLSAEKFYGFRFDGAIKDTFYGLSMLYAGEGIHQNIEDFRNNRCYGPALERMLEDIRKLLND